MIKRTLLIAAAVLTLAAPAHAASVAYVDNDNVWLSSPDGTQKLQLTNTGTPDRPWGWPSQGPDGKTVAYHSDNFTLEDGTQTTRPVLYLYGPDGNYATSNLLPRSSSAIGGAVYPIGLDMDWDSKTVAFGYHACGFACNSSWEGYWLTYSDQQPMNPSDPQGQADLYFPTFYNHRVISSDSGGRIFVQPDVPEAPFTSSYQMWLDETPDFRLSRATVSMTGNFVALDWTQYDATAQDEIGEGTAIGRDQGQIPSDVTQLCNLPAAGTPHNLTFSPDGTQMAWKDDDGVKVAGVPNLAASTAACQLTAPAVVISPSGRLPDFGGADVAAILKARQPATGNGGGQAPGDGASNQGQVPQVQPVPMTHPANLTIKLPAQVTTKAFAKGIVIEVRGAATGEIAGSASIPAALARKAGLAGKPRLSLAARLAGAKTVVIARGSVRASAGAVVKLKLVPTKAAKRAAKRLRKAKVTIAISQGPASAKATVKIG
jgi:hypothetical protein